MTKDVISLSISVLLLFRHYISHGTITGMILLWPSSIIIHMVPIWFVYLDQMAKNIFAMVNLKSSCLKPHCLEPDIRYVASPKFVQIISPQFGVL